MTNKKHFKQGQCNFNNKYEKYNLSTSLEDNISLIKTIFTNDDTLILREFSNQNDAVRYAIAFIDGIVDSQIIDNNIIQPLIDSKLSNQPGFLLNYIMQKIIKTNNIKKTANIADIVKAIISGNTILILDHYEEVLIVKTDSIKTRDIKEPEGEKVLRGSREGFTESLTINLSLIRKRLLTPDLKLEIQEIGIKTHTKVCLCYLEGIANPQILSELKKRLNDICIDGILETGYIEELIKDAPLSLFKTIGSTERPDVAAGRLLEGRIAVIVDGTPVALTVPYLFIEHFQSSEDYYINYYFSSINRMLRILGFLMAISVPAIYASLISFHHELIPTPLFLSIAASKEGIPFPTIIEALALLMAFEILRETGTRMPLNMGQALSIVGALVVGQAAVEARFVSAPIVIVIALSGITGLMISKLTNVIVILRVIFILLSSVLGLYGYTLGMAFLLLHLFSLRSFGVPYMMTLTSFAPEDIKDTVIRAPWWYMKYRQKFISINYKRSGKGSEGK